MLLSDLREILWQPAAEILAGDEICLRCSAVIDTVAKNVARNLGDRETNVIEIDETSSSTIWARLDEYWGVIAASFDPTAQSSGASEDSRIDFGISLGKLERNLIAGLSEHQQAARRHELHIRALIFHVTTFTRIEDPRFFLLQSMLAQLLSNLVSPIPDSPTSEDATTSTLRAYLSGQREDDVIIRLLESRDSKVNSATLQLLSNVTRHNVERQQLLLDPVGLQWLSRILGRMDDWLDSQDGRFELAHTLFENYISHNSHPVLFSKLAIASEPITPSQTSLLKLIDSHLAEDHTDEHDNPNAFLVPTFAKLAEYASFSIKSGVDDGRLPRVLEALVLVGESLGSIGLAVQGRKDRNELHQGGEKGLVQTMKDGRIGLVKPAIELLAQLRELTPRLKPNPANPVSQEVPTERSLGGIKVTLVKLIGVLSYDDTSVGDQVREAEGVQLILSMTEVDELNPYLREHALFTIRNLMRNNLANQAIITQMNPVGVISDDGEVLPLPEKMRRSGQ